MLVDRFSFYLPGGGDLNVFSIKFLVDDFEFADVLDTRDLFVDLIDFTLDKLDYFRRAGAGYDPRMQDALDVLLQKRRKDGRWPLQAKHAGQAHFDMEAAGRPSRWNTLRALRVLREADVIDCEDTRQTRKLLSHYGIDKPLLSYHEHNEAQRAVELVERLREGQSVAVVSDAGTPLLADPGYRVVKAAAAAKAAGLDPAGAVKARKRIEHRGRRLGEQEADVLVNPAGDELVCFASYAGLALPAEAGSLYRPIGSLLLKKAE